MTIKQLESAHIEHLTIEWYSKWGKFIYVCRMKKGKIEISVEDSGVELLARYILDRESYFRGVLVVLRKVPA